MPGRVLPNAPRRDSGSGSYWSHDVCTLHISVMPSDVELTSGGRCPGGTRSAMLVRVTVATRAGVYDGCSDIVLPCWGQPVTFVARSCSMRSSARRGVERALRDQRRTHVEHLAASAVTSPPIQKNGIDENTTSSGPIGYPTSTLCEWRITAPCVCSTPFGSAVLPGAVHDHHGIGGHHHVLDAREEPVVDPRAISGRDDRVLTAARPGASAAPHTWTARRNGASSSRSLAFGRLVGEARQRALEPFDVVVVQEAAGARAAR